MSSVVGPRPKEANCRSRMALVELSLMGCSDQPEGKRQGERCVLQQPCFATLLTRTNFTESSNDLPAGLVAAINSVGHGGDSKAVPFVLLPRFKAVLAGEANIRKRQGSFSILGPDS